MVTLKIYAAVLSVIENIIKYYATVALHCSTGLLVSTFLYLFYEIMAKSGYHGKFKITLEHVCKFRP